ncbi:DUF5655 domain-containing protein [Bailinhaonella thermotolerans]|uniref:DUF5655 domain-containing protein n=1 Tax=Bailinhaonella thermotolerans TaxID=1070861 RepID=A0A3A4A8F6_9ACTN|nr:DUF5655 domain-containing protein [Bailinhaonella thermotolerans]RJL24269.1 hypothetical protein D5H75_30905 [Bailinhaonella thermotolerans]
MERWVCPGCDREFERARQAHVCVPGCTVDEVFEPWPPAYREIYDRLLDGLGPVHEDAVGVGVFLKSARKFAEVRPKARSLSLALVLERPIAHPLLSRSLRFSAGRTWHFFKLTRPEDVDGELLDLTAEAYDEAS